MFFCSVKIPLVDIHTHYPSGKAIEPQCVGVHPWDAERLSDPELQKALLAVENAVTPCVIGEIGLDFAVGAGDRSRQKMVFAAQLRIAQIRCLPVLLHCVRAFEPVMDILSDYKLRAVVFHGFVGSLQQARRATAAGYFLSFGERSLASPKTLEALRHTPSDRVLLETDESVTPISEIYSRAAEILAVPLPQLTEQLYSNYLKIFT